jgi:hypothetical protein
MEQNDDRKEVVKMDRHFTSIDKLTVTKMMQFILCLNSLNLIYDKEKLLTDKDYRWSVIEKLYEKPEKPEEYKNWTILRYFGVNKSEDNQHLLKTDKYIKIREDYEKQFEKERQERKNKELVPKSVPNSVPKLVRKSVPKSAVEVENNQSPSPAQIIRYLNFIRHQYNEKLIRTNLTHRNGLIHENRFGK